jgi:hypothetical protein
MAEKLEDDFANEGKILDKAAAVDFVENFDD